MFLLTGKELRQTVKVSRATYGRWLQAGMPSIGYDRCRRFRLDDVMEWLRQGGAEHAVAVRHSREQVENEDYRNELVAA